MTDYKHLMDAHDKRQERLKDYRLRLIQIAIILTVVVLLWP